MVMLYASTNGQANLEAIHPFIVSWHMPFAALSSVIFVVIDRHCDTLACCSKSRSSYVWLLQGSSECSVQMDLFKLPKVSVCAQNTSGLNFCVFVACLGTNTHQFSIWLPNTLNATNNILFYCCLCVASGYTYDHALLGISLAFSYPCVETS